MTDLTKLRVCVDRVLPLHKQFEAATLAREERQGNHPDPSLLPDLLTNIRHGITGEGMHHEALVMLTRKKWDVGRTIKVAFLDGPEWARVKAFALGRRWSQHANLRFERTEDLAASDIRISFEPGDGSWSYMGVDCLVIPKDEPTMKLGWLLEVPNDDAEWRRVTVHEFGHAIDFGHEQAHPTGNIPWNKEAVYAAYGAPPNNWSRRDVDSQVFFKYSMLNTNFSEYDRLSIMHYAIPAELLLDPAYAVGWNSSRSKLDNRTAMLWYPKASVAGLLDSIAKSWEERG